MGSPIEGLFVRLEKQRTCTGGIRVVEGPTDKDGVVTVPWTRFDELTDLEKSMRLECSSDNKIFTGDITAKAVSREDLKMIIILNQSFSKEKGIAYPVETEESQKQALRILEKLGSVELSVQVEHDGEGITVKTETVTA